MLSTKSLVMKARNLWPIRIAMGYQGPGKAIHLPQIKVVINEYSLPIPILAKNGGLIVLLTAKL